jgi:hypothetical protein
MLSALMTAPAHEPEPSSAGGVNDRDAEGKFVKGNQAGKRFSRGNTRGQGNPHYAKLARNRSLFLEVLDEEKLKAIIMKLYWEARGGSMEAIRIVLQYCIGKPLPLPDVVPEGETHADA